MQEEDIQRIQKEVDRCQDARFVKEPLPNANQNYWSAAEELDRYVRSLRNDGYWI